jgi:hypothetical protein
MFTNTDTDTDHTMILLLNSMELCELYSSLNIEDKKEFLRCIKTEYYAIDDEFSKLIEHLFYLLEKSKDGSILERNIELLIESKIYPIENINTVLQSMLEYLKDVIEYLTC